MNVTLHEGDCLAVLRTLADASIDAIVTDPPYGLAEHKPAVVTAAITAWTSGDREHVPDGRGFMGRAWDGFVPPPAVWDECLRVLKPGGHLLCFAGTRTVDLMGLSIRLAGFEIRDSISWLYGCLTADTEVLTDHGWRPGIEIEQGDRVAQWDHETGEISLAPASETFRAPWEGPMRVLRSTDTDQVLTPNHRVYHRSRRREMTAGVRRSWYEQNWQVAEASELSTWNPVQLPIAGEHNGNGIGGTDYAALLGWVWTEGGFDHSGSGVRVYQSSVNAEKVADIDALLDRLGAHKRYDYERTYMRRSGEPHPHVSTTWYFSGELAERVRADLPGKRPTYDLLWRMTLAEKRALRDAALAGDGSRQRSRNGGPGAWQFYQQHEDDLVWFSTLLALVGQAGKVGMRSNRPGGAVYVRDRSTTELQARHLRDDAEHYQGEVWCVRVPTGAFVVRRNGHVFITGNSGFPKSLDVSKAIDATILHGKSNSAGMRKINDTQAIGLKASSANRQDDLMRAQGIIEGYKTDATLNRGGQRPETAPATDAAKQWAGFGTALKPASEPVIWAQKPFKLVPLWEAALAAHHSLGALLWLSISPATRAELSSSSSPHALPGGTCASALAAAAMASSPGESEKTATFSSPALESMCLSIVSSWSGILAALSGQTNTFTTSTASSTTTALRTLNSLLAPLTSPSIMPRCVCLLDGHSSLAPSVAANSNAEWARWRGTLSASAHESVIEGIALAASNVLASIAADLSSEPQVSTAQPSVTTQYPGASSNESAASTAAPSSSHVDALDGTARFDAQGSAHSEGSSASEPIIVARKPLVGTVAANVQAHGTGALNIEGCRIAGNEDTSRPQGKSIRGGQWSGDGGRSDLVTGGGTGRWPTNVVLDEHAAAELDEQSGTLKSGLFKPEHADNGKDAGTLGAMAGRARETATYGDSGGASRFFPVFKYQAKAPTRERPKVDVDGKQVGWPTVKPLELMRWLVRLVGGQPGSVILDPFAGTGTTGQAAELEGFASVLIERDELALRLIRDRLSMSAPVSPIKRELLGQVDLFDLLDEEAS